MRLLFVSHSFPPEDRPLENLGGMQRVATEFYEALQRRSDLTLRALVLRSTEREVAWKTTLFLLRLLREIPRLARDVDVVLYSSMVTASLAPWLRPKLAPHGTLQVAIAHGQDVTLPVRPYQSYLRRVFRALDAVFPVSRATASQCMARGLPPERCEVIPNGIRPDRFPPRTPADRLALLDALAIPEEAYLLLSVGRQVRRKGFHWFVDHVMPRLDPSIHYLLAGDGPMQPAIREAVARHGLEERVHLLGRVPESMLGLLYRGSDLFIMPNIPVPGDMEGFGVVMLEAGLSGLPTLASRLEGIQDVIAEGINGHLLPPADAEAFVRCITYYRTHPRAWKARSQQAREYVLAHFTWDAIVQRHIEALQRRLAAR